MKLTPGKFLSFCSLIFLFIHPVHSHGQAFQIDIDIHARRDSQLVVAGYYFGGLFVKDSLLLDSNGKAAFCGNQPLPQGIYQLYLNKETQYDFLVGQDQYFSITIPDGTTTPEVKGASESEKFQAYINYLAQEKARFAGLTTQLGKLSKKPDSASIIKAQIKELDESVKKYRNREGLQNKNSFYGKILLASYKIETDELPVPQKYQANDSLKWAYQYNYRKKHYWDYFDLNDLRLWHTPFVNDRLNDYFNKVLLQTPDSVLPEAVRLIEKYRSNPELFQNLTSYLLNNSIRSKVMGMENVFVALAKQYYLSGQANWADTKTLENIRREVALRENNLTGNPAPELLLEDANGEFRSLKQSPTPYTLLAFWEPGCSHCQHEIPKLYTDLFLAANPSKLSVYAVYTMTDKKEWTDFIAEHQLADWTNVWDPRQVSDMKILYDVRTTPSLFLLDKDKKIIAKQLDVAGMKHLLKVLGAMQ